MQLWDFHNIQLVVLGFVSLRTGDQVHAGWELRGPSGILFKNKVDDNTYTCSVIAKSILYNVETQAGPTNGHGVQHHIRTRIVSEDFFFT
jgi:hypothetical protein